MLAKLLEAFQNGNSQSNSSPFDFEAFRKKSAQALRQAFRTMDDRSKREFLAWLAAVRDIRNRSDLNYRQKETLLLELGNEQTVFRTLKAVLDSAVDSAPLQNQQILRTSLAGIGLATSLAKAPQLSLARALFSQALPKFLLTPQFEIVAAILEKELELILKEIESSPK